MCLILYCYATPLNVKKRSASRSHEMYEMINKGKCDELHIQKKNWMKCFIHCFSSVYRVHHTFISPTQSLKNNSKIFIKGTTLNKDIASLYQ